MSKLQRLEYYRFLVEAGDVRKLVFHKIQSAKSKGQKEQSNILGNTLLALLHRVKWQDQFHLCVSAQRLIQNMFISV